MLGELNANQIESVIHANVIGRLGCADEGQVYVVPITYAYDGESILGFTTLGKKVEMMRNNPQVCFQVDSIQNMANWQSVVAWGKYEELRSSDANEALAKIAERIAPLTTSLTATLPEGAYVNADNPTFHYIVFRIRLGKKTGRFEKR